MTKEKVLKRLDILGRQKNKFFKEMLSSNWAFCSDDQFAIILYSNALEEDADVIQRLRETMPVTPAVKKYLYNLIINSLSGDLIFTAEGYISIIEEIFLAYIKLTDAQLLSIKEAAQKLDEKLSKDSSLKDFWEDKDTSFEKEFSRLSDIPEIIVSRNFEFIPDENEELYIEMRKKVEIYFEACSAILCDPFPWYKPASTSLEGFVVNLFKYDFGTPIFREIATNYSLSFDKIFSEIFKDEDCCTASFIPFDLFEKEFKLFLGKHPEVVCNLYNSLILAEDITILEEVCEKLEKKYSYDIDAFYKNEIANGAYSDIKITTLITMIHYAPMYMFEILMSHTASVAKYDLYMFVNRMNTLGNVDFRVAIAFTNGNREFAEKKIQFERRKNVAAQFDLAIIRHYTDLVGI